MSVDTKGNIPREFDAERVRDCIQSLGAESVVIRETGMPGYTQIMFAYNGDARMVHFHFGHGVFGSNIVSMGCDDDGQTIIRGIVERFSGLFQEADTTDDMERIEGAYSESSAIFVLRWAIAKGYVTGSTAEDMAEADRRFTEEIRG